MRDAPRREPRDVDPPPISTVRLTNPPGPIHTVGPYRLVAELGSGGMASVHLGVLDGPGKFRRWVAVKVMHPDLMEEEGFVRMFLDEARLAVRISHPNVTAVFELGAAADTYFIAMEYVHGEPLREIMRREHALGQAMPPEIACRIVSDAALGLHAAHELRDDTGRSLGVVHRDATPHNLFVTYEGTTKVADFGIAKFASQVATAGGKLKGKVSYMSPEQVAGAPIDRRSDIFTLGIVLWELTTAHRLFKAATEQQTLDLIEHGDVPKPRSLLPGYPRDLERIVLKALARKPADRFRSARELSHTLEALLASRGLFVGNDEVALYLRGLFGDRLHERAADYEELSTLGRIHVSGGASPAETRG